MKRWIRRVLLASLAVWALPAAPAFAQSESEADPSEVNRLVELLDLRAGITVADVGAGSGEWSVAMARLVQPDGHVYSTDTNDERLGEIREAVEKAGLENVTVMEGHATRTNLPEQCCDALLIRNVYHHFGDPAAMNASLWQSLKSGSRLAVIDFAPDSERTAPPGGRADGDAHGVGSDVVVDELTEAGFTVIETIDEWNDNDDAFAVVVSKPLSKP